MRLQYFKTRESVISYIEGEIVATLDDDLNKMKKEERKFYTNTDRAILAAKLHDVRLVCERGLA